jgi:hypothetical protein
MRNAILARSAWEITAIGFPARFRPMPSGSTEFPRVTAQWRHMEPACSALTSGHRLAIATETLARFLVSVTGRDCSRSGVALSRAEVQPGYTTRGCPS